MKCKSGIVFLIFLLTLSSCRAQEQGPDFYTGLKHRHENAQAEAISSFTKALDNKNPRVAAAAAAELMSLRYAEAEISANTMAKIQQKLNIPAVTKDDGTAIGSWAQALDLLTDIPAAREKIIAFLLGGGRNRFRDEAALFVLDEWRKALDGGSVSFPEAESAAINGRAAVSRSRYNEALLFFRITLRESPDLFLQYPDLLADLGRTFQYTATGREGIELFLAWENTLATGSEEGDLTRFLLFFYAARIARQRGEQNTELFAQALPFAPMESAEQADACIWYILDAALADGPAAAISQLKVLVYHWRDDTYFFDIMDRLTRELILLRQWNDILHVFALIRNNSGMLAAKYAWILGRAVEEGFFMPEETRQIVSGDRTLWALVADTPAKAYFRLAYDADSRPSYYRLLSAAALGEPFLLIGEAPSAGSKSRAAKDDESDTMAFLLGFFEHNAVDYASRFIRAEESSLSIENLRRLAEALGAAGQYQESMRLVSLYSRRDEYQVSRIDMELSYPRPYRELVEQYAGETGIDPALLYGLIRMESAFIPDVVSRAGAVGLTQLMPETAVEAADRIRRGGGPDYRAAANEGTVVDSGLDLRNPAANIHIGASYLAFLNERMGDPLLALLAYNGGMNRVRRWREAANRGTSVSLPPDLFLETVEYPETRNYGRSVTAAAAVYRELYY